jgi:hypothetical protein
MAKVLFAFFWKLGGIGLLLLGVLDSSFLFAPLGNDLLVVGMTARHRSIPEMLYYAAMSTIGSVLGCLLVDLAMRTPGEAGLEKHLPRKRLEFVKKKVNENAVWALVLHPSLRRHFPLRPSSWRLPLCNTHAGACWQWWEPRAWCGLRRSACSPCFSVSGFCSGHKMKSSRDS